MSGRTKLIYEDFRALKKGEAGYSKTKRSMVSPSTGEIIPVARFQKLAKGGKGAAKSETVSRHNLKYANSLSNFLDKQNKALTEAGLSPMTRGEGRTNPEFKRAYADLKKEGGNKQADRSAHGKLAQALEDLGIRDTGADYPVGETPD